MKTNFSKFLMLGTLILLSYVFLRNVSQVKSATTHIVISEVQIAGQTAGDEFVELYNPTGSDIDLSGWRLTRETSNGATTAANLVSNISGTIKSHGYFLIVPQSGYTGSTTGDLNYSTSNTITSNNTVLIYSDAGITLVDKVGMGTAADRETASIINPAASSSIERKANSTSTVASMTTGVDQLLGNGEDTDNNTNDFITRVVSDPQNSHSPIEPSVDVSTTPTVTSALSGTPGLTPTSTPLPTDFPSVTPTATSTPTPTVVAPTFTPTITPTITSTPAPTATPTQAPSPTTTPTVAPTATPTPTVAQPTPTNIPSVTPTATLTPTPSPILTITPTPTVHQFPQVPFFKVVCTTRFVTFNFGFFRFDVPFVSCSLVRL